MEIIDNKLPTQFRPRWGQNAEWPGLLVLAGLAFVAVCSSLVLTGDHHSMSPDGLTALLTIFTVLLIFSGSIFITWALCLAAWRKRQAEQFEKTVQEHWFEVSDQVTTLAQEAVASEGGRVTAVQGTRTRTELRFPEASIVRSPGVRNLWLAKTGTQVWVRKPGVASAQLEALL